MTTNYLLTEWKTGDTLNVGRLLMESLDPRTRVARVAAVLGLCGTRLRVRKVENLKKLALSPGRWNEGANAIPALRKLGDQRKHQSNPRLLCLLMLAETAAKVIYNASDPHDPFEKDASWWLATVAKSFSDEVGDPDFELEMWHSLSGIDREIIA